MKKCPDDTLEDAKRATHSAMEGDMGSVFIHLQNAEKTCCSRLACFFEEFPLSGFEGERHQRETVVSVLVEAARDSILESAKEGRVPSLGGY